jgi:hypothetical protein
VSDQLVIPSEEHHFSNRKEVRDSILEQAKAVNKPEVRPSLAQKILDIQANVPTVKKKGTNREHNYKFLQIEDAVLAVNKMLSDRQLIMTQNLRTWDIVPHTGGKGYISKVLLEWTLEDVGTGEKREYVVPGEGYDTTDKGTPKAITASRKQAIITIFNLPVGDNPEAHSPAVDRQDAKAAAQAVGAKKIAEAAARGSQTAIDAISQLEPERKLMISRPQEHNGNYIVVTGFIAVPQLERFFDDTGSKRFKTAKDAVPYWRVPSEYEKGLIAICQKLNLEVEG